MTKGKLVNKQTGQTLTGEAGYRYKSGVHITIDGDDFERSFSSSKWDFIEDKPSAYEQYVALKPGARFVLDAKGYTSDAEPPTRVKLDNNKYVFIDPSEWEIIENAASVLANAELTVLDNES